MISGLAPVCFAVISWRCARYWQTSGKLLTWPWRCGHLSRGCSGGRTTAVAWMMFPVAVGGAGPAISFTIPSRRSSKHEIKRRGERAGTWRRWDAADGCC